MGPTLTPLGHDLIASKSFQHYVKTNLIPYITHNLQASFYSFFDGLINALVLKL
jgi:hypothetical protein